MSADDSLKNTVSETNTQSTVEESKPIASNAAVTNTNVDNVNRKELIETAVRFLQNPKVLPTPIENKRLFLAKKGLTESEIEYALKQSGSYNVSQSLPNTPLQQESALVVRPQNAEAIVMASNNNQSLTYRIFKWVSNIIFAGCVAYTAYKLLIKKFFMKTKSKAETSMERMLSENNQLKETIKEMRATLETLKESVEIISNTVKQLNVTKSGSAGDSDIKNEVQSIKSLLLNRTQFPALPTVTPILPSWQLENKSNTASKKQASSIGSELLNDKKPEINDLTDSTIINDDLNKSMTNDTVLIDNLKLEHDENQ